MRKLLALAGGLALLSTSALAEEIGSVDTTWRLVGSNDRIVVEAYDDPGVPGVTCHVSRAQTGGVFATTNPNEASIACRQVGPIDWDSVTRLPSSEPAVFKERTALLFKELKVARMVDLKRKTLVYLVYTTKLLDGSPKNVVSTVPVMPWN
jgi:CreA protein